MADDNEQASAPSLNILAQYTKDLSFENPNIGKLIASAPGADEDFEREVRAAREEIGPPRPAWPS